MNKKLVLALVLAASVAACKEARERKRPPPTSPPHRPRPQRPLLLDGDTAALPGCRHTAGRASKSRKTASCQYADRHAFPARHRARSRLRLRLFGGGACARRAASVAPTRGGLRSRRSHRLSGGQRRDPSRSATTRSAAISNCDAQSEWIAKFRDRVEDDVEGARRQGLNLGHQHRGPQPLAGVDLPRPRSAPRSNCATGWKTC